MPDPEYRDKRFEDLLEAAPDAIMQVDADGRIVLMNRVTEAMFGYQRDELLGKPVETLIPQQFRGGHEAHRNRYRRQPMTRPMGAGMVLEGLKKDGTVFPVEISLSPSQAPSGGEFFVTAIIRDITERKLAEDRLRSIREKYTQELTETNRELEIRNREVERADRLKSEFLASMSHELRTPLHTIIGFSELLAEEIEGPLNEKQKRFVNHIHKDSQHLLHLINDILDISKIEAGRLELRYEAFHVANVVDESLNSVRALSRAKSLEIKTEIDVPEALDADRLRVKQVLVNLLSNAVKFTPEGGRVSVRAKLEKPHVVISVIDTGVGIRQQDQGAIFDKFYQASATTKGIREGTGLGLAITRKLVEQHGGTIHVASEPGRGATFTFTLPLRRPAAAGATS